jgi:Domain of Unknown Function (DUF1080)
MKTMPKPSMPKRSILKLWTGIMVASLSVLGCSSMPASMSGWTTLLDGTQGMDNWAPIGDANWRMVDGVLQADKGSGFLISKNAYGDFQIRAEFWADSDANSGIFIRMSDTKTVTAANSYEVNIFDKRPGQEYSTGAIVDVAKVTAPIPKVGGQWSVYEITAKGSQLTVTLNGVKTVDVQDTKHARGPIALQYAPGVVKDKGIIKFRKVQVKAL